MEFFYELARTVAEQGIATTLLRLKDNGFKFLESDPWLVLVVDIPCNNSILDANNGIYGLPVGVPGAIPWPGGASCCWRANPCWCGPNSAICIGKIYRCGTEYQRALKWGILYILRQRA
jgi:hypothetical protein